MMNELEQFEKSFLRTQQKAEMQIHDKRKREDLKLVHSEIHNSLTHAQISLEKMLENISVDQIKTNKEHIDNIYYHLGAIKGCL